MQKNWQIIARKLVPKADKDSILNFYSLHSKPHILNGFFAKKIILVEGETEELSLPIYFEAVGLDTLQQGIALIGVGGKGNLAKWWRLFTLLNIPTFVCFDNDSNDDEKGQKRRDALKAIGITENEIKKLLTTEDWNVNDKFCVFGSDFETTMRNSFQDYSQHEQSFSQQLGGSKPIIARAVASKLTSEFSATTELGWAMFTTLKEKIIGLNNP